MTPPGRGPEEFIVTATMSNHQNPGVVDVEGTLRDFARRIGSGPRWEVAKCSAWPGIAFRVQTLSDLEHQRGLHGRDAYSWSGSLAGCAGGDALVVGLPLAPPVPAPAESGMLAPPIVGGAPGSGFTFPGVGTGSPP